MEPSTAPESVLAAFAKSGSGSSGGRFGAARGHSPGSPPPDDQGLPFGTATFASVAPAKVATHEGRW
jgi:hypothetical protein